MELDARRTLTGKTMIWMGWEVLRTCHKKLLSQRCGLVQLCVIELVTNEVENVGKKATWMIADAGLRVSPLGLSEMRTVRLNLEGGVCCVLGYF